MKDLDKGLLVGKLPTPPPGALAAPSPLPGIKLFSRLTNAHRFPGDVVQNADSNPRVLGRGLGVCVSNQLPGEPVCSPTAFGMARTQELPELETTVSIQIGSLMVLALGWEGCLWIWFPMVVRVVCF